MVAKFDNEQLTGRLRFSQERRSKFYLQQEYKCWHSAAPAKIFHQWRNVPLIDNTTATSPAAPGDNKMETENG